MAKCNTCGKRWLFSKTVKCDCAEMARKAAERKKKYDAVERQAREINRSNERKSDAWGGINQAMDDAVFVSRGSIRVDSPTPTAGNHHHQSYGSCDNHGHSYHDHSGGNTSCDTSPSNFD